MASHAAGNNDTREQRKKDLTEQYGKEAAEKILRSEEDNTLTEFHQPPDQGVQSASAYEAMQEPRRREQTDSPNPVEPDADRNAVEHRDTAEEAADQGRKARKKK